jgi:hypothetical protein
VTDSAWSCTCPQCRAKAVHAQVIAHYGAACACCGTTERLTIDHVNGGGTAQLRDQFNYSAVRFYRWLVSQGFPPGFQTLCQPCNSSKNDGPACRLDHSLPPGVKRCGKCGHPKPASEFYRHGSWCKTCWRGRDRTQEYAEAREARAARRRGEP